MKIINLPMVDVWEAANEIANWLHRPNSVNIIYEDITRTLTDTDSQIVVAYLPDDEDSLASDYDIECEQFFRLVQQATKLPFGGKFLAKLD